MYVCTRTQRLSTEPILMSEVSIVIMARVAYAQ